MRSSMSDDVKSADSTRSDPGKQLRLPRAKIVIRYYGNRQFLIETEHGERIPPAHLELYIPRVYEALEIARKKARSAANAG